MIGFMRCTASAGVRAEIREKPELRRLREKQEKLAGESMTRAEKSNFLSREEEAASTGGSRLKRGNVSRSLTSMVYALPPWKVLLV